MPTLELAKEMLRDRKDTATMEYRCFGIPVKEYDKEDLLIIIAMIGEDIESTRKMHECNNRMHEAVVQSLTRREPWT